MDWHARLSSTLCTDQWSHIEKLRTFQIAFYNELQQPKDVVAFLECKEKALFKENDLLKSIEDTIDEVIQSLVKGEPPVLRVPKKQQTINSESRVLTEEFVSASSSRTGKRFAMILTVLSKAHELILSNSFATLRDIYYENVNLFERQQHLDKSVEDMSKLLGVSRRALRITATGKGLLAGNLSFITHNSTFVDVKAYQQGITVPDYVNGLHSLKSEARFILVVEKDATFQTLMQSNFLREFSSGLLITGKGYPDVCTRQMLHRLWIELKIPVFALVDADPYGLHIASVYKFGSLARDESNLKIPGLVLLGVLPSDLSELKLPEKAFIPLSPRDHGKLASLLANPHIKRSQSWLYQISHLQNLGKKAEIQCLTHISHNFLTSVYLPSKLSSGRWII